MSGDEPCGCMYGDKHPECDPGRATYLIKVGGASAIFMCEWCAMDWHGRHPEMRMVRIEADGEGGEVDQLRSRVDELTVALIDLVDATWEAIPFVGFEGYVPERTEQLRYRVNAARAVLGAAAEADLP